MNYIIVDNQNLSKAIRFHVELSFMFGETRWRARASKMVARGLHSLFDARAQAERLLRRA